MGSKQVSGRSSSAKKETQEQKIKKINDRKERWDAILQPFENVVDTVWQGETDKAKKKRLEQDALIEAEEKKKSEELQQKLFDYGLYLGMGCIVAITVVIIIE